MYQHDSQRQGRSEYVGPKTNEVKSSYKLTEASYFQTGISVASDGTIYVGTSNGLLALKEENGQLKKEWFYYYPYRVYQTPLIGPDGTVYILVPDKILAITPFGSLKWEL